MSERGDAELDDPADLSADVSRPWTTISAQVIADAYGMPKPTRGRPMRSASPGRTPRARGGPRLTGSGKRRKVPYRTIVRPLGAESGGAGQVGHRNGGRADCTSPISTFGGH